jgi:hypothetical protein
MLIREKRQTNQEIFIGMTNEGLERHIEKHFDTGHSFWRIHHDIELGYMKGFTLDNTHERIKKELALCDDPVFRDVLLSNLLYMSALGTIPHLDERLVPSTFSFDRQELKGGFQAQELALMGALALYSLGTRFRLNDYAFCFRPFVPKGGLPPIHSQNVRYAQEYFREGRVEILSQLGLPVSSPLKKEECAKLCERVGSLKLTVPIYS